MARKSRYFDYARCVQKMRNKNNDKNGVSTKESVISKLKKLKGTEFSMSIPIAEGQSDEH